MKKIELVAPGGSLEKIEYAYQFGADAVYVGLPDFSLRSRINEFTDKKLEKAVAMARGFKKKIYFTLNIYAHERHLPKIKKHLKFIAKIKPDAVIVSDPGIVSLAKKILGGPTARPKRNADRPQSGTKIHLSTQANTTNSEAVKFWQKQGVSRIILAREVTLGEIKKIRKACPKMELEYFVHGAMCMSLSGRCLLSSWMRSRSANLGDCVQPCRWPYQPSGLEFPISNFQFPNKSKIQNPNSQNMPKESEKRLIIEEDDDGSYIFNSKDLCLIEHLHELKKAGVDAFKIEGRTKSVYYAVQTAKVYRQVANAIETGKSEKEIKKIAKKRKAELEKLTNRGYTTGFLFGKDKWENNFECSHKRNKWQFVGETRPVKSSTFSRGALMAQFNRVKIHNALKIGEKVEIITPSEVFSDKVKEIKKIDGEKVESAHGGSKNIYFLRFSRIYPEKSILRKML